MKSEVNDNVRSEQPHCSTSRGRRRETHFDNGTGGM